MLDFLTFFLIGIVVTQNHDIEIGVGEKFFSTVTA